MLRNKNFLFGSAVFFTIVASRWINIPNFNPVLALAVVGGALIPSRIGAFAFPMIALLLSDVGLAFQSADPSFMNYIISGGFLLNYAFYFAAVYFGCRISARYNTANSFLATLLAAVIFFIGSNLVTFLTSGMYPLTGSGLVSCYTLAIPFFTTSLAANLPVALLVPVALKSFLVKQA